MFFFKITQAFPNLNYVSKPFLLFLHFENKVEITCSYGKKNTCQKVKIN